MNVQEVYDQFRSDAVDVTAPYLWSDDDVFRYMNDAYKMFARLTGGIADVTSEATEVPIAAGEVYGEMHQSILNIIAARRQSDGRQIRIINQTDLPETAGDDYGRFGTPYADTLPGPVTAMVIGAERNKCQWIQVPVIDDVALLRIYRLPLVGISVSAPDMDFEFDGIEECHHTHLVLWMRRCAYLKDDAETLDPMKADKFEARFRAYCAEAKAEVERYKHKNRQVVYGGI